MNNDKFTSADYYTLDNEVDDFEHTTVEDLFIDLEIPIKDSTKVLAHKRVGIHKAWVDNTAEGLAETAMEFFEEEYGNPNGDTFLPEDIKMCIHIMKKAIRKISSLGRIYWCEQVAEREYSRDEIKKILKEYNEKKEVGNG